MKLSTNLVLRKSVPTSQGSWGGVLQIRKRKGLQFFAEQYGSADTAGGFYGDDYRRPNRILSSSQMWEIYRRCSDVRSAIDSIVRRVATFDWLVEPIVSPQDPSYESLKDHSIKIEEFLKKPNKSGQTYQEIMTAFLTDLLCFDAGTLELVYDRGGKLSELVPLRGSTIVPIIDSHGVVLKYEQQITNEGDYFGTIPDQDGLPSFKTDQILFMSLYTNTSDPAGNPLMEALVNEVIALLRGTEHAMLSLDADEIPQGILVLAGIAGRQAEEAKADLQRLKGQDHKIRVMTTPDPSGIGAKWLELRRSPKEIDMRLVIEDIRRCVYRTFGVMPVEMGMADGINRATAQVQMDVSTSHLVTPIIELIQSKITGQIIPLLVDDPEVAKLLQFRFDREARLSPPEQKALAEVHQIYVRNGVMTRNEAREILGLRPLTGGDVATVDINVGTVPLTAFDKAVGQQQVADVIAGADEIIDGEPEEEDPPPTDVEEVQASKCHTGCSNGLCQETIQRNKETRSRLYQLDDTGRDQWFTRIKQLPSEWQNPAGYNTIDLKGVADLIGTYIDNTVKEWRRSRKRMLKELVGKNTTERRRLINKEINTLLDKWERETAPLYELAFDIGRKKAISLTKERGDEEILNTLKDEFIDEQLVYLRTKLLRDLRKNLNSLERSINVMSVEEEKESIEKSYNRNEYRIAMYGGALLALAYRAVKWVVGLTRFDPLTEWTAVGDKNTCATCNALDGTKVFLSERDVLPAEGTECLTRCRCILSYL